MICYALLSFNLFHSSLQIVSIELNHVHGRNKHRRVCEEVVHLLQRTLSRLGQESPEENGVREVAYLTDISDWNGDPGVSGTHDEQEVEPPSDFGHGDLGSLTNHGIKGKGHHTCDGNTFRSSSRVKYLCWNDP